MLLCVKGKNSYFLTACWFFKNNIMLFLFKILGVVLKKVVVISGFEIVIEVVSKNVYPIISFLSKHTLCEFKLLTDIVCYDVPKKSCRFTLVYNLISIRFNIRLRVLTKLKELSKIFSVGGIYTTACWFEREIFDFFGIFFVVIMICVEY